LTDIIAALKKSGSLPEKLVPKIVTDIMISISRYVSEQNLMPESDLVRYFKMSDVLALSTPDEAFEYLKNALSGFCGHVSAQRKANDDNLLARAKKHISEHYHEAANLVRTALELSTTPEHLNAPLTAQGSTYCEYVGRLRLNESRRLIKETDFTDEQIALKIGYDDVRHFRGLFKQQFGLSPQDFRSAERGRFSTLPSTSYVH